MFNNKIEVVFIRNNKEMHSRSTSGELKNKDLLEHLNKLRSNYGSLCIDSIDVENQKIYITNEDTKKYHSIDGKVERIKEIIIDYIEKDK